MASGSRTSGDRAPQTLVPRGIRDVGTCEVRLDESVFLLELIACQGILWCMLRSFCFVKYRCAELCPKPLILGALVASGSRAAFNSTMGR